MVDINKIVEQLGELTVLEAIELVNRLEKKWGVSSAIINVVQSVDLQPEEEEKTEFDVIIKETKAKKIKIIKMIRQLTHLGLKDAKELAEATGSNILESVSKEVAADAKARLEMAGAVVELG